MEVELSRSEKLSDLRAATGKTAREVAEAVGVSASSLCDFENKDDRVPSCEKLALLAQYYGVSMDYLCGLSSVKSLQPDIAVCEKTTGLSVEAVQMLADWNGSRDIEPNATYFDFIDYFLSAGGMGIISADIFRVLELKKNVGTVEAALQESEKPALESLLDKADGRSEQIGANRTKLIDTLAELRELYDGALWRLTRDFESIVQQYIKKERSDNNG